MRQVQTIVSQPVCFIHLDSTFKTFKAESVAFFSADKVRRVEIAPATLTATVVKLDFLLIVAFPEAQTHLLLNQTTYFKWISWKVAILKSTMTRTKINKFQDCIN